ncbi:MAG: hypothetical protein A2V93_07095 [Ignavibacteria bacterium RBG_16_34_14]|nr:MAG: hypothetical protein A2V93_07095 [Ignavibacteria bacterium RBG_16_34_14]
MLLEEQIKFWPELEKSYSSYKTPKTKTFKFNGFVIKVQNNPGRITSSSAKVDEESIKVRACFLCPENLYSKQKAIQYGEDFLILVNPFPIFPEHFTIPHKDHIPQAVKEWFGRMPAFSKDFSRDVIIYNGPACGASAPDHLHFQAGSKFFMPIDNGFHSLKNEYGEILIENDSLVVAGIDDGLRKFISIETKESSLAEKAFDIFYHFYSRVSNGKTEPMMNIICFYEPRQNQESKNYGWRTIIFLREKHRPSHYFREGENRILLSPAAVDFGGVCILPLEKDFEKITKEDVAEIFREVSIGKEQFEYLKADLKKSLKANLHS